MNLFIFVNDALNCDMVIAFEHAAPAGRRERNKQEKRTRLIAAARRLFARKGFDAATMQDIAQAADLGLGTLYLYAPSKEDLLILVSREELETHFEAAFAARLPGAPLLERLVRLFDVLIDYHNSDAEVARALMKQLAVTKSPQGRRDARHITRRLHDRLRDLVLEAQSSSELRGDAPVDLLVGNLYAIYRMQLQMWLNEYMTLAEFRALLRDSLDLQLVACRAQETETIGRKQWRPVPERSSSAD
jgi:AcrR family transcriptional regulator